MTRTQSLKHLTVLLLRLQHRQRDVNRRRIHARTGTDRVIPRLQPRTHHRKVLQRNLDRRAEFSDDLGDAHVSLDDFFLVLRLPLLGRHAQQGLSIEIVFGVGCELFEVGAAGWAGEVAVSLEAGADGARRGEGEGVFRVVSVVIVGEEVEMSIEIVIERLRHRLHRCRVVLGKYSEIVRSLILERVHVLRDVDFHVYCRAWVGWVAEFPSCDHGTVGRLGVMLGGCLEERFAGVCSLGSFVRFQIFYSVRTRGQGRRETIVLPFRRARHYRFALNVTLHQRRPKHSILPVLKVSLQIIIIITQPGTRHPPRPTLLQRRIHKPTHITKMLVLLIPQSKHGIIQIPQKGCIPQRGCRGGR
mmetsp:Transcript_25251/g.48261  ORF Transcript_25251/g.48261 Transcript_25251/m.48261 type:complete len:359 (-) Transcript_25251:455-1531(-)